MDMKKVADSLVRNGFDVQVFSAGSQAAKAALDYIGSRSVGIGGSWTIHELGLYENLTANGNQVAWHWRDADKEAARRQASTSDIYLASSNAVTVDGCLVNIDGTGNRVASMAWGPKEVLLIVGRNKIAADTAAAVTRIHEQACGKNARRLGLKTPCATLDRCTDCSSPDRMCRIMTTIEKAPHGVSRFQIYLVDEDLGF